MPLSLKEITQREKALRQEIQEREHLLRAYASMRADRSEPPVEEKTDSPLDSADDEASSAAPPAPQLDPELAHLRFGGYGSRRLVAWAIRHMKDDFDLHDIADLLARCDCHITNPQISVVLSRMNQDGKLELIRPGSGRAGAVYRPREGIHL